MEDEAAPTQTETPTPRRRWYRRLSPKARLAILGVLAAVSVTAGTAVDFLLPRSAPGTQALTERFAWYCQHGQWRADMHTLASVLEYLATSDSGNWATSNPTNPPLARNATPTPHKS